MILHLPWFLFSRVRLTQNNIKLNITHMRKLWRVLEILSLELRSVMNGMESLECHQNLISRVICIPAYSVVAHCALIALQCSKHHRPFNSILDDDYCVKVQMLRSGTILPHPITVSHDICEIHLEMAKKVHDYFKVCYCLILIVRMCLPHGFSSCEITLSTLSWMAGQHQL
jgi:hypothetical protein